MMKVTRYITMAVLAAVSVAAFGQDSDRDCIRMGNKYFRDRDFSQAETYYRKALDKNESLEAYYNLGGALTFQQNDSLAFDSYRKALGLTAETQEKKAWVYHNMGNLSYLNGRQMMKANSPDAMKAFAQAVECYKSALRCNPKDDETRYNLAMAQYMLKKNQQNQDQQQQQNQDQQNQDQQKDQNKDQDKQQDKDQQQQDQDKQENQKDKQDQQQNQDQQQQQKQDQQQQQRQQQQADKRDGQMDDRTAEQLLNSAQQDEKGVQRKVQKAEKAHRRGLEKDW